MSPVFRLAVLLAVCAIATSAPAPLRYVTYNQTQHGNHNVQADLENILIVVVPSRKFISSALGNIFDRRDIPSQKNIPEPPEIATEVIKEENLPEPPEPAKVEEKPQAVNKKDEVKPVASASSSSTAKDQVQDTKPVGKPDKPAQNPSSRAGRGSVINAKLLGYGVSPATD